MCELLAISSRLPTTVELSLERLARHGGIEAPHRDGWGVAFYEGPDVFLLREPGAAAESALVRCIEKFSPSSQLTVAHIRLATQGEVALRNTQPFIREMGGYTHVFAHNGKLANIEDEPDFQPQRFNRVGNTDSNLFFVSCWIAWRNCGPGREDDFPRCPPDSMSWPGLPGSCALSVQPTFFMPTAMYCSCIPTSAPSKMEKSDLQDCTYSNAPAMNPCRIYLQRASN